ncbi:histidine phosphatase superfamily, partial [Baffinella frigidus]
LEIWVCRHGQTEDNSTKTAAGWNAGGLSATGITQATQLGERLRAESFDSMHVSDLRRTEMTANLVNEARQNLEPLEWIKDSRLREKGAGANEGKPVGTSERQAKQQGVSTRIFRPEGGGESWEDVATRARSFIRSVVRTAAMSQLKHRRILVVTHGGWI